MCSDAPPSIWIIETSVFTLSSDKSSNSPPLFSLSTLNPFIPRFSSTSFSILRISSVRRRRTSHWLAFITRRSWGFIPPKAARHNFANSASFIPFSTGTGTGTGTIHPGLFSGGWSNCSLVLFPPPSNEFNRLKYLFLYLTYWR